MARTSFLAALGGDPIEGSPIEVSIRRRCTRSERLANAFECFSCVYLCGMRPGLPGLGDYLRAATLIRDARAELIRFGLPVATLS